PGRSEQITLVELEPLPCGRSVPLDEHEELLAQVSEQLARRRRDRTPALEGEVQGSVTPRRATSLYVREHFEGLRALTDRPSQALQRSLQPRITHHTALRFDQMMGPGSKETHSPPLDLQPNAPPIPPRRARLDELRLGCI